MIQDDPCTLILDDCCDVLVDHVDAATLRDAPCCYGQVVNALGLVCRHVAHMIALARL